MGAREWLERSAWDKRRREFGDLVLGERGITMVYPTPESSVVVTPQLWTEWRKLPAHGNILAARDVGQLGYAALDWSTKTFSLEDRSSEVRVATVGRVLLRVYDHITASIGRKHMAWFLLPRVYFDLEGQARIAFCNNTGENWPHAPEVFDKWPSASDSDVVYAIGQACWRLIRERDEASKLHHVLTRCIAVEGPPRISQRITTLHVLDSQLQVAGAAPIPFNKNMKRREAWNLLERGRGWLEVGELDSAHECFNAAQRKDSPQAHHLLARELAELTSDPVVADAFVGKSKMLVARHVSPEMRVPWNEVKERGLALERERDFGGALVLYSRSRANSVDEAERQLAMARCHFARSDERQAMLHAERALVVDAASRPARDLRCRSLLALGRYDDALPDALLLCESDPSDARAHYLRGKALLGRKSYPLSRAAFEQALSLDPFLVEAMLLRREVDRAMKRVRSQVGQAVAMTMDVPKDLPELRAAMMDGALEPALELLTQSAYIDDATAQLYRGHILLFVERWTEALIVFERVSTLRDANVGEARLGHARALAELGRYPEALDVIDRLRVEQPDVVEAQLVRAYIFGQQGRKADAEAAQAAYLSAASSRSV